GGRSAPKIRMSEMVRRPSWPGKPHDPVLKQRDTGDVGPPRRQGGDSVGTPERGKLLGPSMAEPLPATRGRHQDDGAIATAVAPALERLQGSLLFLLDVEKLIQLGDLEDLVDLRVDVAKDQAPA